MLRARAFKIEEGGSLGKGPGIPHGLLTGGQPRMPMSLDVLDLRMGSFGLTHVGSSGSCRGRCVMSA